jgi:hypothetical protein
VKPTLCALISGVVVFTALIGHAADDFLDNLKRAAEQVQQQLRHQQQKQGQGPPPSAPQTSTQSTNSPSHPAQGQGAPNAAGVSSQVSPPTAPAGPFDPSKLPTLSASIPGCPFRRSITWSGLSLAGRHRCQVVPAP